MCHGVWKDTNDPINGCLINIQTVQTSQLESQILPNSLFEQISPPTSAAIKELRCFRAELRCHM